MDFTRSRGWRMMHNMHPACKSGAAIQYSHSVTPFLKMFCFEESGGDYIEASQVSQG